MRAILWQTFWFNAVSEGTGSMYDVCMYVCMYVCNVCMYDVLWYGQA